MSEIAPHTCCLCGSPAYVGFNEVQCTNAECRHYHLETVTLTYSYGKGYEEAVTDTTIQLDSYIQDLERLKDE